MRKNLFVLCIGILALAAFNTHAQDTATDRFALGIRELDDIVSTLRESFDASLSTIDATFLEEATKRRDKLTEELEKERRDATLADQLDLAIELRDTRERMAAWSADQLLARDAEIKLDGNLPVHPGSLWVW